MYIFKKLKKKFSSYLKTLTFSNSIMLVILYGLLSWIGLYLAGERDITSPISHFIYFLVVTASTVGYGDFSPQSDAGKWITAFFIIPGGLSLFAFVVGQSATYFINHWRKGILGKQEVKVKNHILILGWNKNRTLHMLDMLLHEEEDKREIVLCITDDIENPLPEKIKFVRVSDYTNEHDMKKTAIQEASCIIIDTIEDNTTLTSALFATSQNKNAHLIVYFNNEILSNLLKEHCPNAECIPSVAVEMMAKSAVDPGSSSLHQELLSTTKGMTQYSVIYPKQTDTTIEHLFHLFKAKHDAILIAIEDGHNMVLNPPLDTVITKNTKIFYIADERINTFLW